MFFDLAEQFKRQPHKMVKHTQTICRQQSTNCLSVFDNFVGFVLKGLKENLSKVFGKFIRHLTIIILQANSQRAGILMMLFYATH